MGIIDWLKKKQVTLYLVTLKENDMDTFENWLMNYFGKKDTATSATELKLRTGTIDQWVAFAAGLTMERLSSGKPAPTTQEILDEWRKDHPPAIIKSTPFGDTVTPISAQQGLPGLLDELKALVARYGG